MFNSLPPHGLHVALQAPLSLEVFMQECWSGLPFPPLGDLPNPEIEPGSPALQTDALPPELQYFKPPDVLPQHSDSWAPGRPTGPESQVGRPRSLYLYT